MVLKIIKNNGKVDALIKDGKYLFQGKITIGKNGIESIDDGNWIEI